MSTLKEKQAKQREYQRRYTEKHYEEIRERRRLAWKNASEKKKQKIRKRQRHRWETDAAFRERDAQYHILWNKRNPEKLREYRRRHKYGLEPEDIERMHKEQGGNCALCKEAFTTAEMSVDHSHRTGKVRGLLCRWCNTALGRAEKRWDLGEVAAYLQRGKTEIV